MYVELEEGVHRSTCSTVLAFFFGGVTGFTSLSVCTYSAFISSYTCSYASIGALNAESFCERVLSAANLVVTDGNTLLSSEEVEMLSVLRINRRFMELCRSKFAKEAKQQFNQTVIDVEASEAAAASAAPPAAAPAAAGSSTDPM